MSKKNPYASCVIPNGLRNLVCTVPSIYTSYAMNMHSMKIAAQKVNFFLKREIEKKISLSPSPNFPDIKQHIVTASECVPHSSNFKIN